MRNILLILFLFLLFSCKKEEYGPYYVRYEWHGKSNSGQASSTGLEVTYTYSNTDKPVTTITDNNKLNGFGPILVPKGFVATLRVKNNCKPLACYIKPVLRIYTGGLMQGTTNSYYWHLVKEDSSTSIVDSLTISYTTQW